MPIGFLLTDAEGRVVRRNRTLQSWSLRDNELVIGRVPPGEIRAELDEVARSRQIMVRERTLPVGDGTERPVLVYRFPIVDATNALNFVGTLVTDLSDIKRMEGQFQRSEARLQRVVAALDRSQKGVIV